MSEVAETEEEQATIAIAMPNLDPDAAPLTDAQIKFGLHNHAEVIQHLVQAINQQDATIVTLMYVLAAYMKQYPLDMDALDKQKIEVPLPGQYL